MASSQQVGLAMVEYQIGLEALVQMLGGDLQGLLYLLSHKATISVV